VEGVIEERIGRLEDELREILSVASVEGEAFTAQVVAAVDHVGERRILRLLSRELGKRHRLVREGEVQHVGAKRLARYWFSHALFQQYLYNDLSRGERTLLHGEIAELLEALYEGDRDEIAAQLAHHYARAGIADKAAEYLSRAGDRARLAYAHQAAIDCYRRAVAFMKEQERYGEAARTLMKLGLTCHNAFRFGEARRAYEEGFGLRQQAARAAPPVAHSPAPHALRVHGYYWGEPSVLDPALAGDFSSGTVVSQLFGGLAALSPEQNVVPDIAQWWEVLDAGSKYVFHLRDDVRWSDGVALTAGDFEYAWRRALDPVTGSLFAESFFHIQGARAYYWGEGSESERVGVRATDDHTLVVELEDPTSDLLYDVTSNATRAVPRHAVQMNQAAWAKPERVVTSGPFRLAAWERNHSLVLERNPNYHGRFVGNVERVELLFGPEHDRNALDLYEQDQLDVLDLRRMPLTAQDRARQQHAAEYVSQPIRGVIVAGLNVNRSPLNDRRVRRAMVMAVDRERLADIVYGGLQFPATGGLWPPGTAGHSPGIALPYDPEEARRLLAKAGYPNGRGFPTIEALGIDGSTHLRVVDYLQAQWFENLKIDVPCQVVGISEWVTRVRSGSPASKPTIWYVDTNLGSSRDDRVLSTLEGWWLTAGWQNQAYQQLVERIRRVTDPEERLRICREADQILVEEAPTIVLIYQRMGLLVKPWVTRLPLAVSGGTWWKDTVIEPH
jgi:oligopeptide transport system substrate-binding protein